jgi:hypothetical protein
LELPRLTRPGPRFALGVALLALLATLLFAATAAASSDQPVLVTQQNKPPAGFRLTASKVERTAARDPRARAELRRHRRATPYEYTKGAGQWQVSWFSSGRNSKELLEVYVDDQSGKVTEVWTGFQIAWTMARGYPGAFGRRSNALYVWLPLCALFLVPFLPWRRPRRVTLLHLDLVVLLAFSVSLAFFNHARIGISVPLAYPFLLYLLVRMVLLAFGRGGPRELPRPAVPVTWLAIGVVFLTGFRIGLNVVDSNVIDVGYAGVIGANKLIHGASLYGHWPSDNAYGGTYGPANYYAYVPFRAIFGWSGRWDDLPAAHAATIAFDLLTLLGIYLLGRRIRGPTLGTMLAYCWVSYPFTLFTLNSNSNDTLIALLVVAALLVIRWAPARGAAAAIAGLTKFAPLALGPLFLRGTDARLSVRGAWRYVAAFAAVSAAVMLPVFLDHNESQFWHDTISYQATRPSPFSIWGLWGGLGIEQRLVQAITVVVALGAAVLPRRRGLVEVCALAAAILIAVELSLTHWFYLYIVWFFPLVMAALLGADPKPAPVPKRADEPAQLVPASV